MGLGVNSALGLSDAFAISNILTMLGVNTSGQERKNKLSFIGDGQNPINFEADITVSPLRTRHEHPEILSNVIGIGSSGDWLRHDRYVAV